MKIFYSVFSNTMSFSQNSLDSNFFFRNIHPLCSSRNLSIKDSCYHKSLQDYCCHLIKYTLVQNSKLVLGLLAAYPTYPLLFHHHHFTGRTSTRLKIVLQLNKQNDCDQVASHKPEVRKVRNK